MNNTMTAEQVAVLRLERGIDDIDEEVRADVRVVLDYIARPTGNDWVLVPRVPNDAMLAAGIAADWVGEIEGRDGYSIMPSRAELWDTGECVFVHRPGIWDAMLDAAPATDFKCRAHQCVRLAAEKDARIASLEAAERLLRVVSDFAVRDDSTRGGPEVMYHVSVAVMRRIQVYFVDLEGGQ